MLTSYNDITELIDREPDWYDSNGVPRYRPFEPDMLGVYDKMALLVKIACQDCSRRFLVGEGWDGYNWATGTPVKFTLEEWASKYHYGDPPRHGCIGDTMNVADLEIVEAWEAPSTEQALEAAGKGKYLRWIRRPDIEEINPQADWVQDWLK